MGKNILLPPASLVKRLGALTYDLMAVSALCFMVSALWVIGLNGSEAITKTHPYYPYMQASFPLTGLLFFLFFWLREGQTLGMRAWRIQVQHKEGGKITLIQALTRAGVAVISFATLGLGYFWQLLPPAKKSWHDRASNTIVVQLPKY